VIGAVALVVGLATPAHLRIEETAGRLDDAGRAALRDDLVSLAASHDQGDGDGTVLDWEYRIVTATRR
jgi:hypothetical protein